MERASSSSTPAAAASTSSSSAALFRGGGWFPADMEGQEVRLTVRGMLCTAYVRRVKEEDAPWDTVRIRMPPPRLDIYVGDQVRLQREDGRSWFGDIAKFGDSDEEKDEEKDEDPEWPGLIKIIILKLKLHVPRRDFTKLPKNIEVNLVPVFNTRMSTSATGKKLKIGVNGFGPIERIFVEMALKSIDVEIVAINSAITPRKMVKNWRGVNASMLTKDSKTVIFEKRHYVKRMNEKKVYEEVEQMEVAVFRESGQVPWHEFGADFIVDCAFLDQEKNIFANDLDEITNNCLRCLPKKLYAYGCSVAEPIQAAALSMDNKDPSKRPAELHIVISTTDAEKAVCKLLPSWDGKTTCLKFYAAAAVDKSIAMDTNDVLLKVVLERSESLDVTSSTHMRSCDDDGEALERLLAILSWCIDVIRCVPVARCRLKLI